MSAGSNPVAPAGRPASYQSKAFVFTLNNPTAADDPSKWGNGCVFGVSQLEVGESGTPHLQGYILLDQKKTIAYCRRWFSDKAYWAPRGGSHEQAVHYATKPHAGCACEHCVKASKLPAPTLQQTWGVAPKSRQGARTDLESVREMVLAGKTDLEIADEHFSTWCRHHRAISLYRLKSCKGRDPSVEVKIICLYGPPGTGKTRLASMIAPDAYWVSAPNSFSGANWWDGYEGQTDIVLDEFYGWIPHPTMLRICDRYQFLIQSKGGTGHLMCNRVIITSNKHPEEWWPRTQLGAMVRRLTYPMGNTVHLKEQPEDYEAKMAQIVDVEQFSRELPVREDVGVFVPNQHPGGLNGFEAFVRE